MKMWAFLGTYQMKKLKFFAQYNPGSPQADKILFGVHGRHGKRLESFAEIKIDQSDKTETSIGFKTKFVGGEIGGTINSSGVVESQYRKFVG